MDKSPESFQWLVLIVFQAAALIILSQLNQSLATASLFLFLNGLFIAFPALFLPIGQGTTVVVLIALFYDSGESWTLGTSLIPTMVCFLIVYTIRNRIRYDRTRVIKPVVLLVNLALYFYYTILAGQRFGFTSPFIFQNIVHLLVSQLILFVIGGWLVNYQKNVLRMCNVDVDSTSRAAQ